MTVCYFGIYKSDYSRNRILIKGLRENGVNVIECRTDLKGARKYIDLIKKHWRIRKEYDTMIVGFPGYHSTIVARFITRKKIIFDAFTSIYDSMVFDRQLSNGYLLKKYYWMLDWLSCQLANTILLDTNEHIKYFVKTFRIKEEKFVRIFVGSDDYYFKPIIKKENKDNFLVHFHGSFIPLQGVEYIIDSVKLLEKENINVIIIGTKIKEKYKILNIKNVQFLDNIAYEKLGDHICEADVALGIFGNTDKAKRAIPNKVYEYFATRVAVVTGKTKAVEELLSDRKNVLFCEMSNSRDLADKILELRNNTKLRDRIAENGYNLFKEKLTPKILAEVLLKNIN